jgi:hypothetical protein
MGKKLKGRNHHHLVPKSRGGKSNKRNLLLMDIEKHRQWHVLFGDKTLEEVIALLKRIKRIKSGRKITKRGTMSQKSS